jgi:hypothetical protein
MLEPFEDPVRAVESVNILRAGIPEVSCFQLRLEFRDLFLADKAHIFRQEAAERFRRAKSQFTRARRVEDYRHDIRDRALRQDPDEPIDLLMSVISLLIKQALLNLG